MPRFRVAVVYLGLTAVMLGMLSTKAERSWILATLWAGAMHWVSGTLILGLAGPLRLSLSDRWFALRRWESDGVVYRRLGIEQYKRALLASPFGANPFFRFRRHRAQLPEFERFTRDAEMGHLILLAVSVSVAAVALESGHWRTAIALTVINMPWNLYPVLLQRYTRARLQQLRRRR